MTDFEKYQVEMTQDDRIALVNLCCCSLADGLLDTAVELIADGRACGFPWKDSIEKAAHGLRFKSPYGPNPLGFGR